MHRTILLPLLSAIILAGTACAPAPGANAEPKGPFEPDPPRVYVAKVKNILVGLAPTGAEIASVEADPEALGDLVDGWMKLPTYEPKMMRFFQLAFQQTQISSNDFLGQLLMQAGYNTSSTPLLLENIQEGFARTMVAITSEGRPLTEAMTTKQLMMTTVLKEFYAFLDTVDLHDDGAAFDHFRAENYGVPIMVGAAQGPIPISQTLDRASPNYMHWYNPDVTAVGQGIPGCQEDPVTLAPSAATIHYLLLGTISSRYLSNRFLCPRYDGSPNAPQFGPGDFSDWTMVTLRSPGLDEATTKFYDLPALRATKELVLSVPRVGFFSTPAFFANWPTNTSNQMRATMHQALIVATGTPVDVADPTVAPGSPGLDHLHATGADCLGCHKTLDPTRSIFSATWSWSYRNQDDATFIAEPGMFAFRGVVKPVNTLEDFGAVLAEHPLVASGWVQKLCYYVNSARCQEDDPEFLRLVDLFQRSNFSWSTLVKAFVTSPLTTYAGETETVRNNGTIVTVSRRDHFCAAISTRLGRSDACQLGASDAAPSSAMPLIVSGLPSDAYGRGAVAPILPNQPTLFLRAGIENICESLAAQIIDVPSGADPTPTRSWSSSEPDAAIDDFVGTVMALGPSDSRAAPAAALLKSHFASALAQPGVTPTEALQSTFVVACLSPSAISIGL